MAKKAIEPTGDHLKELETQRGAAQEALESHKEREATIRGQLEEKESTLRSLDVELNEQIEGLLKNIPPGDSARLIGELEQFRQSGRFELTEQITVLKTALRSEKAQVSRVEGEIRALSKQIEQEVFDKVAREKIHPALADFTEKFKVLNGLRLRIFQVVQEAGFTDFSERFKRLGLRFPLSFGVLCESHLSKRNPDGIDVAELARRLESIGQAYNEKPLQLPGTKGMLNPHPTERNWYFNAPPTSEREN